MNTTYALIDPRTSEAKYVGCTKQPASRLYSHMNSRATSKVALWVNELKNNGLAPEMVILEYGLNYEKGRESESFWFEYLRSLGCVLLNTKRTGDRGVSLVDAPLAWYMYYGNSKVHNHYAELVANSQPF